MSDVIVLGVVTAGTSLMGTFFTGFMAFKMAKLKISDQKLDEIHQIASKTLTHVNDQFLIQLRLYKESTRTITLLKPTPENLEKADMAEKMYNEHAASQAQIRNDAMTVEIEKAKSVAKTL